MTITCPQLLQMILSAWASALGLLRQLTSMALKPWLFVSDV